jgi:hypothetical protein
VAGEEDILLRLPSGEGQEPPHSFAEKVFLTKLCVFLAVTATRHVSMYYYYVGPQVIYAKRSGIANFV